MDSGDHLQKMLQNTVNQNPQPTAAHRFEAVFGKFLHTQEVTGSSPVVSTKKFLISSEIRNFSIYFSAKSLLQNLTFALTNTLTNTAKVPHRTGQHRAGFPARLCFFTRFWNHYSESKKLTLYCDRVTDGYRCKDRGSRFNRNRKKEQDEALLFTFRGSGPP